MNGRGDLRRKMQDLRGRDEVKRTERRNDVSSNKIESNVVKGGQGWSWRNKVTG